MRPCLPLFALLLALSGCGAGAPAGQNTTAAPDEALEDKLGRGTRVIGALEKWLIGLGGVC